MGELIQVQADQALLQLIEFLLDPCLFSIFCTFNDSHITKSFLKNFAQVVVGVEPP